MTCKKDCKLCKDVHMISNAHWCYDDRYGLPALVVLPQRFTAGAGQQRSVSIEDMIEKEQI